MPVMNFLLISGPNVFSSMQSGKCWWLVHVSIKTMSFLWFFVKPFIKIIDGSYFFFLLHLTTVVQPTDVKVHTSFQVSCIGFILHMCLMWLSTFMLHGFRNFYSFIINVLPFVIDDSFHPLKYPELVNNYCFVLITVSRLEQIFYMIFLPFLSIVDLFLCS